MAPYILERLPGCVRHASAVSDISNATFNGLAALLSGKTPAMQGAPAINPEASFII